MSDTTRTSKNSLSVQEEVDQSSWTHRPFQSIGAKAPFGKVRFFGGGSAVPTGSNLSCLTPSTLEVCSYSDEQERAQQATRRIFHYLTALTENDLDVGRRSYRIGELLDREATDEQALLEATSTILSASGAVIQDAAKAAFLRGVAARPGLESRSELLRACIASLWAEDELQAVAAARTLAEIADAPAAPQIKQAMRYVTGARVKQVIAMTLKEIEGAHGLNAGAPAGP